ncbi:MAG TPA: ABC transporter permease [Chloroflexota bacterium]|nr:ABC transporter permease [Chloroflexota bacterium]
MSLSRVWAVLQQEAFITARSVEVVIDLPWFSLMTIIVFGFITRFFSTVMDPTLARYLFMGTLLWEIIRIAQYSMSLGALWNIWSHNFSNMFITPLSMPEYILAQMISATAKAALLFSVVCGVASVGFGFNLFGIGLGNLALLFANLLVFAWSIGIFILGIILRLGTRIQALAWGFVFLFQPLCAAYYPLQVLPGALQPIARALPPTWVFEAARASLQLPAIRWNYVGLSAAENVVYFALALWFFTFMYRRSRQTGQFARNEE